jgi:hypothetical protein
VREGAGRIEVEHVAESVWLVEVLGEHDISIEDYLGDTLVEIPQTEASLILDFTHASFIDSTVINTILRRASHDPAEASRITVVAPTGSAPRRVFDLIAPRSVIRLVETVDEALRSLPST